MDAFRPYKDQSKVKIDALVKINRHFFLGGSSDGYHNPTFHNHVWDNTIFVVIAVIDQIKVACWCWRCCLLSRLSRPSALLDLDADLECIGVR